MIAAIRIPITKHFYICHISKQSFASRTRRLSIPVFYFFGNCFSSALIAVSYNPIAKSNVSLCTGLQYSSYSFCASNVRIFLCRNSIASLTFFSSTFCTLSNPNNLFVCLFYYSSTCTFHAFYSPTAIVSFKVSKSRFYPLTTTITTPCIFISCHLPSPKSLHQSNYLLFSTSLPVLLNHFRARYLQI